VGSFTYYFPVLISPSSKAAPLSSFLSWSLVACSRLRLLLSYPDLFFLICCFGYYFPTLIIPPLLAALLITFLSWPLLPHVLHCLLLVHLRFLIHILLSDPYYTFLVFSFVLLLSCTVESSLVSFILPWLLPFPFLLCCRFAYYFHTLVTASSFALLLSKFVLDAILKKKLLNLYVPALKFFEVQIFPDGRALNVKFFLD